MAGDAVRASDMMPIPEGYFAENVEPIGYHDLDGKPAFKLALQEVNGRWFLYAAHLWHRGWSVLDVTDPAAPELAAYVAGPDNTWTIQIQVAEGKMITALERIAPGWGGVEGKPSSEGFLIWEVSDPTHPRLLGPFRTGSQPTSVAIDPRGKYMYVSNALDSSVSAYVIDLATGTPSAAVNPTGSATNSTDTQPVSIAIDPALGRFVYTANYLGNSVSGFQIDPNAGTLKTTQATPYPSGSKPTALAIVPHGNHSLRGRNTASRRIRQVRAVGAT